MERPVNNSIGDERLVSGRPWAAQRFGYLPSTRWHRSRSVFFPTRAGSGSPGHTSSSNRCQHQSAAELPEHVTHFPNRPTPSVHTRYHSSDVPLGNHHAPIGYQSPDRSSLRRSQRSLLAPFRYPWRRISAACRCVARFSGAPPPIGLDFPSSEGRFSCDWR